MLDREWVSITDPRDPTQRFMFDVTFLTSAWSCIFGRGCPGTAGAAGDDRGCCRFGAHYLDDADRAAAEAMPTVLGADRMQRFAYARRRGVTATDPDGGLRTRLVDGACIFLNRSDWSGGAGCALHQYAVERGEHHLTYKPAVCWMVPLHREFSTDTGDDGEERTTVVITSFDRGAWGPGGSDFAWWCTTDDDRAYHGAEPVYRSMQQELITLVGGHIYRELVDYLERRGGHPPLRLLPLLPP